MKFILLAAAATIAMPAIAQTSGSTGTSSPTTSGAQSAVPPTQTMTDPATTTTTPAPPSDAMTPTQTAPAPADTMTTTQTAPMPAQTTGDPVGGYQPAAPAMSGAMTPGATVVFQPAASPDQAYPAPAPMAKYPVCKKGEFDKCIQGSRSTHSSEVRRRAAR